MYCEISVFISGIKIFVNFEIIILYVEKILEISDNDVKYKIPLFKEVKNEESIKKLPEDLQEVVILHYFQDLKLKEVADIIGIGLPLVKYRIGKAKELLSVYLGDKK